MSTTTAPRHAGLLVREWRARRRYSQLDLAHRAEVSTRHLSFVETGRSRPSRELLVHLAEHLEVPLRERNALLLAAGYAPMYQETPLDDDQMAPVRDATDKILRGHEPFPAVAVDRRWDVLSANTPALTLLTEGVDPALMGPPPNALRVTLHPDGMAPRIVNFDEWSRHLMDRLRRQAVAAADDDLHALYDELAAYPGVSDAPLHAEAPALFVPIVLRSEGAELRFFSTMTTFGTALDITVAELAIESFFPADSETAATLRERFPA